MGKYLTLFLLSVSALSVAELPICVRNYYIENQDVCKKFPKSYVYVEHYSKNDKTVCTRIYSNFYCDTSEKEYVKVRTNLNEEICVLNYNQPPVANYCQSVPQFYDYIQP